MDEVKAYMEELGGTQGRVNGYWQIGTLIVSFAIAVFFYNATRKAKVEVLEATKTKGPKNCDEIGNEKCQSHLGCYECGGCEPFNYTNKQWRQAIDQLIKANAPQPAQENQGK